MPSKDRIEFLVNHLELEIHPEGGYYKEIYRSPEIIPANALPGRYSGSRNFSTSIYYLIMGNKPSLLHRIQSDEIWHFYEGSNLDVHIISETGIYKKITMGSGEIPLYQITLEKNSWFGGIVCNPDSYTLLGCTVAPGFDFLDFEMAGRQKLLQNFPQHAEIINLLT